MNKDIARAARILRSGGLVAFPTETVYGLGADASSASAIAKLYAVKRRPADHPVIVHFASADAAFGWAHEVPESARKLAKAFWPGPLTLVLPGGSGRLPDMLRGPDGGIAVRWTSHQAIAALVAALGSPLTSTSANIPGQPPGPGADAIARDFAPAVASGQLLILDGGVLGNRPPSTVVDCTRPQAQIVREGTLSVHELRRAVGRLAP